MKNTTSKVKQLFSASKISDAKIEWESNILVGGNKKMVFMLPSLASFLQGLLSGLIIGVLIGVMLK